MGSGWFVRANWSAAFYSFTFFCGPESDSDWPSDEEETASGGLGTAGSGVPLEINRANAGLSMGHHPRILAYLT